jgi:lipoprotein-anchoring transpeptidase ErfK/SrfK
MLALSGADFRLDRIMSLKVTFGILAAGLMLSGCMQATTYEATNTSNFKPHDKELLAKSSFVQTPVAEPFRRAIVEYHRKEAPGSIVVDSDNHYLYYVLNDGKAIRYGITVGEEAMAWSGIAKVGSMTEWPAWHPTPGEISRLGVPSFVAPGPDNPMGSRAMYLYSGGKDTLFRIHGTNQPEYIGASISSGCIRMTNVDAIDLYNRVKIGTVVVVLEPKHGDSPYNSQMALQGAGGNTTGAATTY